jgi:uridine kinase
MVAIAGPSGSGKTTVAVVLAERLPGRVPVVPLDAYYRDLHGGSPAAVNFDHPDALDRTMLVTQLERLAGGASVEIPRYDFTTHRRRARGRVVLPSAWVVVEGLHALYWEPLRKLWTLSVFIDADAALCLDRRIARDTTERGRTRDSVLEQYRRTVRPMYERFVEPTRREADLVLDGGRSVERNVETILERLFSGTRSGA